MDLREFSDDDLWELAKALAPILIQIHKELHNANTPEVQTEAEANQAAPDAEGSGPNA